jgi:hypothetical protein
MSTSTQSQGGTSGSDPLSPDETFELLSNRRRRYALHHLKRCQEAELGELSRQVASWENGIDVEEVSADERKRVYTSLQQFHLPKMDDQGIVEYDDRSGEVELAPAAEELDVYLEVVEGRDIPWSQYYLGLAAVNAGLVAAVFANIAPFTLLPDIAWAAFVVTTLVVSALVHTYITSSNRLGESETPPELGGN